MNMNEMNRSARRRMKKGMSSIGLINFPVNNSFEGTHWEDVNPINAIPKKKFKKLIKNYKGDLHKDLLHTDKKMKQNNLSYEDVWGCKDAFLVANYFIEIQKFQNLLTFPQVIEILELFVSKLTPLYKKVFYVQITTLFDFVSLDNDKLLEKLRLSIVEVKDYTEDEFYEKKEFFIALMEMVVEKQMFGLEWVERMKHMKEFVKEIKDKPFLNSAFEDEDFENFYDDKDYIVAYRGFACENDVSIRLGDAIKKKEPEEFDTLGADYQKRLNGFQHMGKGVSYSLDKNVALTFAFRNRNHLLRIAPEKTKIRAVVGKYFIRKEDIFSYTNNRSEREIIVTSNNSKTLTFAIDDPENNIGFPYLANYEFFTDTNGAIDKTGMSKEPVFRNRNTQSVSEYSKIYEDTKIERVLN